MGVSGAANGRGRSGGRWWPAAILALAVPWIVASCITARAYRVGEREMSQENYDRAVLMFSRALSGKPARQLKTAWTTAWDSKESPGTLPMPLQFMLTAEAVARIFRSAYTTTSPRAREVLGTAVGQIVGRMKESRSTRDVMYTMAEEFIDTMDRMKGLMAAAEPEAAVGGGEKSR